VVGVLLAAVVGGIIYLAQRPEDPTKTVANEKESNHEADQQENAKKDDKKPEKKKKDKPKKDPKKDKTPSPKPEKPKPVKESEVWDTVLTWAPWVLGSGILYLGYQYFPWSIFAGSGSSGNDESHVGHQASEQQQAPNDGDATDLDEEQSWIRLPTFFPSVAPSDTEDAEQSLPVPTSTPVAVPSDPPVSNPQPESRNDDYVSQTDALRSFKEYGHEVLSDGRLSCHTHPNNEPCTPAERAQFMGDKAEAILGHGHMEFTDLRTNKQVCKAAPTEEIMEEFKTIGGSITYQQWWAANKDRVDDWWDC